MFLNQRFYRAFNGVLPSFLTFIVVLFSYKLVELLVPGGPLLSGPLHQSGVQAVHSHGETENFERDWPRG